MDSSEFDSLMTICFALGIFSSLFFKKPRCVGDIVFCSALGFFSGLVGLGLGLLFLVNFDTYWVGILATLVGAYQLPRRFM